MKIISDQRFIILKADENMYLATKDLKQIFDKEVYLSQLDSPSNYCEITENEYNRLKFNNSDNQNVINQINELKSQLLETDYIENIIFRTGILYGDEEYTKVVEKYMPKLQEREQIRLMIRELEESL